MFHSLATRVSLFIYGIFCLLVLFVPLIAIAFASFGTSRFLSYPIKEYSLKWYVEMYHSSSVSEVAMTSLKVAVAVTIVSVVIGLFGALAFARYRWRFRSTFQKIALLPIFFPQPVMGLALLIWFNKLGINPDWRTGVVGHLIWIAPIATLIVAIRAYTIDSQLEDAARDLGAKTWQILYYVTLPLLAPGIVTAGLFAFLLSWGNFPLSLYTTGVDVTLPEWLYAKMTSAYTPLVPAVGTVSVLGSVTALVVFLLFVGWYRRARNRAS